MDQSIAGNATTVGFVRGRALLKLGSRCGRGFVPPAVCILDVLACRYTYAWALFSVVGHGPTYLPGLQAPCTIQDRIHTSEVQSTLRHRVGSSAALPQHDLSEGLNLDNEPDLGAALGRANLALQQSDAALHKMPRCWLQRCAASDYQLHLVLCGMLLHKQLLCVDKTRHNVAAGIDHTTNVLLHYTAAECCQSNVHLQWQQQGT